jgi:hypothetical protein
MTVALAHERFVGKPGDENIAHSHFGRGGTVTVREILSAIEGRPDEDHINLRGPVDLPELFVCTTGELPKFFSLG